MKRLRHIYYDKGEEYHSVEHNEASRVMLNKVLKEFHRLYDNSEYNIYVGEEFVVGRVTVKPDAYVGKKGEIPVVCIDITDLLSFSYVWNLKRRIYQCLGIQNICTYNAAWNTLDYSVRGDDGNWCGSQVDLYPEDLIVPIMEERPDLTEDVVRAEYVDWNVRLSTGHIIDLTQDMGVK